MGLLFSGDRLLTDNPQAEAQTTGGPNIVFVMAGFLDKRFMQDHPGRREIMNTNGTTFENAYVTYFLCWPSRATILRGQYSHNYKIIGNSLPEGWRKEISKPG